ncbi:response regulator [Sorangium sp. So ce1182]
MHGLEVRVAATPDEAIAAILGDELGAVVQDMNFRQSATSGEEGMELLRRIKAIAPELPVVAMTAFTSIAGAVELIKAGASDYVPKPWDDQKLVAVVSNLARLRSLEQENARLVAQRGRARHKLAERYDLAGLVYASDAMHEVVSLAVKVAPADVPVLITGPNGTGKELLASIVQANSRRRDGPFVKVNAGAPRRARRGGAVRRRGGRLHRRDAPADRQVRGGRRRHPVPRRDRHPVAERPEEAAARPPDGRVPSASGAASPGAPTCAC